MTLASAFEPSSFSHFRLVFKSCLKVKASTVLARKHPVDCAALDRASQDDRRIREAAKIRAMATPRSAASSYTIITIGITSPLTKSELGSVGCRR